jgi:cytochrome P450
MKTIAVERNVPSHVPDHLVLDFDAYNPIIGQEDYQEAFARLNASDIPDIFWSPHNGGHWIVKRRDHLMEAFADHNRFTSRRGVNVESRDEVTKLPRPRMRPIEEDPPVQQAYRKLFASAFTAVAVKELEAEARSLAIELIEEIAPRGRCEFVTEFAQHLPIRIFMRMMGLPDEDRLTLLPLAALQVSANSDKKAAMGQLIEYVGAKVLERRETPTDDLLSRVANGQIDGELITVDDAVGVSFVLLTGGLDTVATMMSLIMRFLAISPSHRLALLEDEKSLPNAVEEFLRRFSLTNPARCVKQDLIFHGVDMREGDMIMMSTTVAGVDAQSYDNPLEVDFKRKSPTKATFGAGPHVCPGSMLARAEIKVLLQEWLSRIPNFRLDPVDPVMVTTGINVSVNRLPLIW